MDIITISQLTPAESVSKNDLVEVTQYDSTNDTYHSRSAEVSTLCEGMVQEAVQRTATIYGIPSKWGTTGFTDGLQPIPSPLPENFSLEVLSKIVSNLSGGDMDLYGDKTFNTAPKTTDKSLENVSHISDTTIPNIRCVRNMIEAYQANIAPSSAVDFNPGNDKGYTVYDETNELIWHIDDNSHDSSKFIVDPIGPQTAGCITCDHDGWLTIYGWVTDNGNVMPQEAWVGLFGKVKIQNDRKPPIEGTSEYTYEENFVLLQMQPWVVGKHSSTMQYVGFGIPVAKGLQLKIKTGFPVSGHASGLQHSNSLLFEEMGMMPNTFVGYILHHST